jgi:heme/copper-type cytochrome/quinol oxidase subunit 4
MRFTRPMTLGERLALVVTTITFAVFSSTVVAAWERAWYATALRLLALIVALMIGLYINERSTVSSRFYKEK